MSEEGVLGVVKVAAVRAEESVEVAATVAAKGEVAMAAAGMVAAARAQGGGEEGGGEGGGAARGERRGDMAACDADPLTLTPTLAP